MKRTTIVFSDPQYAALQRLARQRDLPVSELVRRAIDLYLRHEQDREMRLAASRPDDLPPKEQGDA